MVLSAEQVNLIGQVFESYVLEYHRDDILAILREADDQAHYPVVIDALTLFETNMEIGEYFNAFPSEVLPIFDSALRRAALAALQGSAEPAQLSLKQNLHARVSGECRGGGSGTAYISSLSGETATISLLCNKLLKRHGLSKFNSYRFSVRSSRESVVFIKQQKTHANTWVCADQLPKEKLWPSPLACVQWLASLAGSGLTPKPFQGKNSSKQQLVLIDFTFIQKL